MNYNWDWGILFRAPYAGWLVSGAGLTLLVTLASWIIALAAGLAIGTIRSLAWWPARLLAAAYVELFRNIPPLVQLFLWFFVFPQLLPHAAGMWVKRDMPFPEATTTAVAVGLFSAARVAEQVRAGVETVLRRLLPAALATGLTQLQAYRLILLPIALRRIVGPLTSELLIAAKMSSIGLTIGLMELTAESREIENYTFHGFEAYAAATVIYLAIGLAITAVMAQVERRLRRGLDESLIGSR
jgi:glutamate/aspartate transport system permease protein